MIHNQEPPPKEILENLTAKGGDLLKRTVENFRPPSGNYGNAQDSDASADESKTPKEEKMDVDEPGSGGRTTRGRSDLCFTNIVSRLQLTALRPASSPSSAGSLSTRYHILATNAACFRTPSIAAAVR